MEIERVYYSHDAGCRPVFYPPNPRNLQQCIDCAGIFDMEGKGVAVTDKRFDEEYYVHKAQIEADELRINNV